MLQYHRLLVEKIPTFEFPARQPAGLSPAASRCAATGAAAPDFYKFPEARRDAAFKLPVPLRDAQTSHRDHKKAEGRSKVLLRILSSLPLISRSLDG